MHDLIVRERRSWLAAMWVSVLAWMLVTASIAEAAARVVAPDRWLESSAAAPDAQRRAGRWKDDLGLRLSQVVSASERGRATETVAVFERSEPVTEALMDDEARAIDELARTVTNVVGADAPEAASLRTTEAGERVIWARWFVDDWAYECVLAPSGEGSTLVIIAVLASDLDAELPTIDGMISQLDGVTAPMPRFSLWPWRIGALLVWIALGLALHAGMLRLVDHDDDHATAGRRAALINLGLVALGSVAAHVVLAGRELAIVAAGSSLAGMTEWIVVAGLVVVGTHFLISTRLDRGVVQSAPLSGAFASGVYSASEVIRASRSDVQPIPRELVAAESSDVWAQEPGAPRHAPDFGSSDRIVVDPREFK